MKKLLAIFSICALFFGTLNAKSLETSENSALFQNATSVNALVLDNQELVQTEGKVFWLVLGAVTTVAAVGTGVAALGIGIYLIKNPDKLN